MLSDWPLLLSWAQSGRAEAHFGEAGVTNLLHLLRDALAKATGGPLLGAAPAAEARKAGQRDRQQAQVWDRMRRAAGGEGWHGRGVMPGDWLAAPSCVRHRWEAAASYIPASKGRCAPSLCALVSHPFECRRRRGRTPRWR